MPEKIVTGEAPLRALSLSIQVSNRTRCNASCEFCISRTTPNCGLKEKDRICICDLDRLRVGLGFAKHIGATHAILTGKADPLQEDFDYLTDLIALSRDYLPLVDIHTNGFLLGRFAPLEGLVSAGLTNITFSVASFDNEINYGLMGIKEIPECLILRAVELGLFVRCSLVLNSQGVCDFDGIMKYIRAAGNLGVHAVVIREVWRPTKMLGESISVYDWNIKHHIDLQEIIQRFNAESKFVGNPLGLSKRDSLPWGQPVYVVDGIFNDPDHGVNVTFARCDEATTGRITKSVIHKPNGHGYRNWDSNGDILY